MTNAQIIFNAACKLMQDGVIGTTGNTLTVELDDGTVMSMPEPEEIHTFQKWKSQGYKVKKGEHAVTKLTIWKHSAPKVEQLSMKDGEAVEYIDKGRMFMKTAAFFSRSQVEAMA